MAKDEHLKKNVSQPFVFCLLRTLVEPTLQFLVRLVFLYVGGAFVCLFFCLLSSLYPR